ncbi:MAG TPA: hypothetical protein VH253_06295 [Phycisphaerae bacterium]|nr:hypothetical protein [Phycisphaerae bacterium]
MLHLEETVPHALTGTIKEGAPRRISSDVCGFRQFGLPAAGVAAAAPAAGFGLSSSAILRS